MTPCFAALFYCPIFFFRPRLCTCVQERGSRATSNLYCDMFRGLRPLHLPITRGLSVSKGSQDNALCSLYSIGRASARFPSYAINRCQITPAHRDIFTILLRVCSDRNVVCTSYVSSNTAYNVQLHSCPSDIPCLSFRKVNYIYFLSVYPFVSPPRNIYVNHLQ